jgi:hypothetical protein
MRRTAVRSLATLSVVFAAAAVLCPSRANAQSAPPPGRPAKPPNPSHWGASFSVTPQWNLASQLKNLIQDDSSSVDIQGSEITFGIVRGSRRGGDWGVSFVSKPFKDGSGFVQVDQFCLQNNNCRPTKETDVMQGVKLTGVEVHWFIRFVNIADRAQIGMNVAGGIASVSGTIVKTTDDFQVTGFNPQTGQATVVPTHTVENNDAKDELVPKFPLMKLEVEGSAIITPSLKAKISGGLNFPGVGMRVGLVYLFGAN